MPDGLDFSLPDSPEPKGPGRLPRGFTWLIILLQLALIALVIWRPQGTVTHLSSRAATLDLDGQRDLALKLEKQGLADAAADAWQEYLATREGDATKAAEIWYRIGTLHQEAGQYERALAAYYRSESFGSLPHVADELGRRVQECLEALGKFAALRYELAERTTLGGDADPGGEAVAEIGPTRITMADLDRLIETLVAQQLGQFGDTLTPEQRTQQKEELLKRLSDNQTRSQILAQYITEEVLCRQAREDKLAADPEVAALLRQAERSILAGRTLQRELQRKITITPTDVATFYTANKARFMEPEKARLAHILLPDEQRAQAAIVSMGEGQAFEQLARQLSEDKATADDGGTLPGFLSKGQDALPATGQLKGISDAVFSAEAGTILPEPFASDQGWHVIKVLERQPAKQKTLEEARAEASHQLRAQKEREVQEAFIRLLYEKNNVVIHTNILGAEKGTPALEPGDATVTPPPDR